MKVRQHHLVGQLTGMPIEIVQTMCDHQVRQGNSFDPSVFASNFTADYKHGGFDWIRTNEGLTFWRKILRQREFYHYFLIKRGQYQYIERLTIAVTEADLTGQIEGFPIEVVKAMCKEQAMQGNPINPTVFAIDKRASASEYGFNWSECPQDRYFWSRVIGNERFDKFFKDYHKYDRNTKTYNT